MMVSKYKTTSPMSQAMNSKTEETIIPLPSDRGLSGLVASTTKEAKKKVEVLQKAQISPDAVK